MSIDVLVTAGSRRVALVRAFQRAVAPCRGPCRRDRRRSPFSNRAHRGRGVPRAALDRRGLPGRDRRGVPHRAHRLARSHDRRGTADLWRRGGEVRSAWRAVAASPERTATICNDKFALCEHLRACGIPAARSWLPADLPADAVASAVHQAAIGARAASSAFQIRTTRELEFFLDYVKDPVIQELLEGPEFTIDVLCGFDGVPRAIVPRERCVIRAGVSDKGRTVDDPALVRLARECAAALDFVGAINIQCRVVNGTPTVFEINPRFSGGISLTIASGADFPRMLVDLARGRELGPGPGRLSRRSLDDELRRGDLPRPGAGA